MSDFVAREYTLHARGCRYSDVPEELGWSVSAARARELLTTGHIPISGRSVESARRRRLRACGLCRPDITLRIKTTRFRRPIRLGDPIGGLYAPEIIP